MVDPENNETYYDRLTQAIQDSATDGELVIKWTAIVEILDSNGEKGIWTVNSEDSTLWDIMGMMEFAQQKMRTKIDVMTWAQQQIIENEDDDEDEG